MDSSEKETKEGEIGGKNETVLEKKRRKYMHAVAYFRCQVLKCRS